MKMSEPNSSIALNHLILEKIFNNLETTDLKSCRKVCKLWNTFSTIHLSDKMVMCLEDTRLDRVLELLNSSPAFVPSTFTSYLIKINSGQSMNPTVSTMWSTIHVNIKFLNLQVTTMYAMSHLKYLLLLCLPSLETLKLMIMEYWGDEAPPNDTLEVVNVESSTKMTSLQISYLGSSSLYGFASDQDSLDFRFPVEWKLVFRRYPQIRHICLVGLCSSDIGDLLTTVESVPLQMLTSIEILDESPFPEIPNDDHLRQICTLENQFESFHLEIGQTTDLASVTSLITKHRKTLKTLRLRRYPHWTTLPLLFPDNIVPNVEFFEVSDGLLPSLSFLKYMPVLKRFNIILRDYRHLNPSSIVADTDITEEIVHKSVKSLYIEPPLISRSCIGKLAICFPVLESIDLRVDNEMLSEICSIAGDPTCNTWNELNTLKVTSWNGLTDEGITGISDKALKFWSEFPNSMDLRSYRSSPFVGDIKGLKRLIIEMWPDYDNHLSDWSVLYGVVDISALEEITFIRCDVTPSILSSIHARTKLVSY